MLVQFGLQGCNTCHELRLPSAPSPLHPPPLCLCGDVGPSGCSVRTQSQPLTGPLQRPWEEDSLPMLLPTLQDAPQTGCFSKGSRGRVLPRRGTSRAESTKTSPTARGKGRISGDKQSPFGLWPWCLHEQLAQLCPHSLSLLPPPTLRSGKGTGLGGSSRRKGHPSTLWENCVHAQPRVLRCHHRGLLGCVPHSGRARSSMPWQWAPGCSAGASPALASCVGGVGGVGGS